MQWVRVKLATSQPFVLATHLQHARAKEMCLSIALLSILVMCGLSNVHLCVFISSFCNFFALAPLYIDLLIFILLAFLPVSVVKHLHSCLAG